MSETLKFESAFACTDCGSHDPYHPATPDCVQCKSLAEVETDLYGDRADWPSEWFTK